jgi:tetratricopeptide (TPR) repeat protein
MYQAALQKNPDCWVLHADLGDILVQSGENQAAVNELNEALQINPDCDAARCNLGTAWANLGNFSEAVAQLQKAIQLNPNLYEAYHQLTMVYAQTDRPDDALATADKALALARSDGMKELASKIETWEENFKAEHPRAVDSGSQPGKIMNQR